MGYGYAGGDFFLTDVVKPDLARPHVADRNAQLLEYLGLPTQPRERVLDITPEDVTAVAELLKERGIGDEDLVIGIHAGAGAAIREWGDERFAEVGRRVVEQFGAKILWFSDPSKPKAVPVGLNAVRLNLPFRQFLPAVDRCQLFVSNDSGPMHLAAGLGVPVVAIFGPQRPEWFGPYGEAHRVVIRNDIWCRPCGDSCIWDEPHCLRLISVEQVMEAVTAALKTLRPIYASPEARR